MESRRAFLGRCGTGAAVWTALGVGGWETPGVNVLAAGFAPDQIGELAAFAMSQAKSAGASYADIRINRYRNQSIGLRVQDDRWTGKPLEVPSVWDNGSFGFGLRVLADGAWGFSASCEVSREAIALAAGRPSRSPGPMPHSAAVRSAGPDAVLPRHLPHQDRHRPVRRPDRAEAGSAALWRLEGPLGRGGVLGQRIDRLPSRRPLLRLNRGERHRAARLPDRSGDHRDGCRGRP